MLLDQRIDPQGIAHHQLHVLAERKGQVVDDLAVERIGREEINAGGIRPQRHNSIHPREVALQ